jgi:aldose 1-epimerase
MSFEINIEQSGPVEEVELINKHNGTKAIVYSKGALLNHFSIQLNGEECNVVDGVGSVETYLQEGNPEFKSAKLSPYVCRLNKGQYEWNNTPYQVKGFFIEKHAIHGLLYDQPFDIISTYEDEHQAYVVFSTAYQGFDAGFPFTYECRVTYTLLPNDTLSIQTVISNNGDQAFPITDGWHPYFSFGKQVDELVLQFTSSHMLVFDAELIPTGDKLPYRLFNEAKPIGSTEYDNCFELDTAMPERFCLLSDMKQGVALKITPDDTYPYLQIYIPPHRNNIAIENLSAAPDAFNNKIGLKVVEPGETANFTTHYSLSHL